ncbi:MAG TPA: motility protein A [Caldithrix abyssi]|uniref:Motility protein A n=1 Tax=Caldithrix abyssi TaxID=187145 RepID=A0A7V4WUE4_CALAY|nr:motility protein A [Caldithrix abyssi]
MDLATIVGIVAGFFLISFAILSGGDVGIFIHVPSMMIVVGGATAATLISFQLKEVLGVISVIKKAFFSDKVDSVVLVETMVDLSKKARREGLLAIDKEVSKLEDPFMRTGMEMVVDGTEPEVIRGVMETELSYLMERHKKGQQILNAFGTYAPAFGMIGTLIGLVAMLTKLDDPSQIGGGMAVALITTFYGALLSNLVFLPLAGKLKNNSDEEVVIKEMIIEGVLSIQLGEHPNTIQRKLLNFLAPKERLGAGSQEAAG